MLATSDLFVYAYVLVDDAIAGNVINIVRRPGRVPACSDAEVLTITLVRHMLGRRSEEGFRQEVLRDFPGMFPRLPVQSEFNRRVRWLWGAFEQLRGVVAGQIPVDNWGQVDTSALPVKHPSRMRGPDCWVGPNGLVARFGRDAAHGEWFYGFRLAVLTDLSSRTVRAWAIVPAALNERDTVPGLLEHAPNVTGILADKGFNGKQFAADLAKHGVAMVVPPTREQRQTMPVGLQKVIAQWRNRIETTFGEITDRMELARHGAHTFWGLLARTAATICAHTILRLSLPQST